MSESKCSIDKCNFEKYTNSNECILHCSKKDLSKLRNPYFTEPESFYKDLITYIVEDFFSKSNNPQFDKKILSDYLYGKKVDNIQEIDKRLRKIEIVFTHISFPNTDEREQYNYEKLLKKLGKIWFNFCSFYIPSLDIEHIECTFQDCEFYEYWSLKNFKVSEKFDDLEIYNACTFYANVSASGGEKDKFILDNVQFNGCTFKKELTFENINALKPIFKDWHEFTSTIKTLKVDNCILNHRFTVSNYSIENLHLKNTIFSGKFEVTNNTIESMDINNCNFEKLAEFYATKFNKFKIFKSIFIDYAGFEKCKFGNENNIKDTDISNFQYVTFLSFINFRNTEFRSGLLFEDTNLKEYPNFLNAKIKFENTSKETFRIIKHSFDKLGNHTEANKYFSLEMKKYKENIFKEKGLSQEKIIFWLNGVASNYGESYWKATKWLLFVSFIYMLLSCGFKCDVFKTNILLDLLNIWAKSILPFGKFLPKNIEFITLLFSIIESALIWHIAVALKRHTRR